MEDRVPVFEICRYFAFAAFLDHGRPSVGLAPTIVWDCILASASVFTVALPATNQMLKGKVKSVEGDHVLEGESRGEVGWVRQLCPVEDGEVTTKRRAESVRVASIQGIVRLEKREKDGGRH